jgi:aminocarboxymuconate-semialdehyde decarboxylase
VDTLGADRVVIGSDYPFDMGFDDPVGALAASGLGADVQARIAGANAVAFLDG